MPPDALDFGSRSQLTELMDEPCSREVMRGCLRDIAKLNRWFLGYRPLLSWLDSLSVARRKEPLRILDVGCGYGDGLRLISKIEETSVSEQKSNVGIQDPIVNQSVLEAPAEVNSGKPVMLGSLEMPDGNRVDVQVTAEVLQ